MRVKAEVLVAVLGLMAGAVSLSAHRKRENPVRFMACKHRNVQVRWSLWQVRRYAARSELRSAAQFGYMGNPYVELGTMPAGGVC